MWPIFFNIASHAWIAYLFFVNGLLLHYLFRRYSLDYRQLTLSFETHAIAAFALSISLNGLLLIGLDQLNIAFDHAVFVLPVLSLALIVVLVRSFAGVSWCDVLSCDWGYARAAFYFFIFVLLFYNGGLIEKISDAWWHMSLANKISLENSFELSRGHLNGVSERYYPPLWHGNLALANRLSGISIPVLWNSFTAWGAVLKVMAFFLLGYALSKDKATALLGALFFVLLPGIGNSYLRVSAWPSHIAYTFWFVTFAMSFALLDQLRDKNQGLWRSSWFLLSRKWALLLVLATLLVLLNFTHQVELVWFAIGIFAYLVGLSMYYGVSPQPHFQESGLAILMVVYRVMILGLLVSCAYFIYLRFGSAFLSIDKRIAYGLPILVLCLCLLIDRLRGDRVWAICVTGGLLLVLALSVNYTHLVSLFVPELALPGQHSHELPLIAKGWFGHRLEVPSWRLQLRQGFLYSGVVGLFLALFMAFRYPSQLSIFVASTALIAMLFCVSPYLHQWLRDILAYHSPWRIALLSFHPLIFASVTVCLCRFAWQASHPQGKRIAGVFALLIMIALVIFEARPHFDEQLIHLKRQSQSAQRNWNIFYSQRYVFYDSMLRYQADLAQMKELLEPDVVVLADLPTSYYIAATLPLYVPNVHKHQGFHKLPDWSRFLDSWHACTMHIPEGLAGVARFIEQERALSLKKKRLPFKYIVLNNDTSNRNLRGDCLWFRKHIIKEHINDFAEPIFEGDYLQVYELK